MHLFEVRPRLIGQTSGMPVRAVRAPDAIGGSGLCAIPAALVCAAVLLFPASASAATCAPATSPTARPSPSSPGPAVTTAPTPSVSASAPQPPTAAPTSVSTASASPTAKPEPTCSPTPTSTPSARPAATTTKPAAARRGGASQPIPFPAFQPPVRDSRFANPGQHSAPLPVGTYKPSLPYQGDPVSGTQAEDREPGRSGTGLPLRPVIMGLVLVVAAVAIYLFARRSVTS